MPGLGPELSHDRGLACPSLAFPRPWDCVGVTVALGVSSVMVSGLPVACGSGTRAPLWPLLPSTDTRVVSVALRVTVLYFEVPTTPSAREPSDRPNLPVLCMQVDEQSEQETHMSDVDRAAESDRRMLEGEHLPSRGVQLSLCGRAPLLNTRPRAACPFAQHAHTLTCAPIHAQTRTRARVRALHHPTRSPGASMRHSSRLVASTTSTSVACSVCGCSE